MQEDFESSSAIYRRLMTKKSIMRNLDHRVIQRHTHHKKPTLFSKGESIENLRPDSLSGCQKLSNEPSTTSLRIRQLLCTIFWSQGTEIVSKKWSDT